MLLAGGLWLTWRARRTDRTRAAFALWGGWLLVTGLVFSFMQGIYHAYYEVALAPAIAALVGMGAVALWRHRDRVEARVPLAGALAVTTLWSFVLLRRTPDWLPWLPVPLLLGGLAVAALLLAAPRRARGVASAVVAAGLVVALAGPAAYALDTAATPHSGAIPSAGPAVAGGFGPGGRPGRFAGQGGPGAAAGSAGRRPQAPRPRRSAARAQPAARAASAACSTPARRATSWSPCCGRAARATPGWPPRSGPTPPPGSSSPATSR